MYLLLKQIIRKTFSFLLFVVLFACNTPAPTKSIDSTGKVVIHKDLPQQNEVLVPQDSMPVTRTYANARFKDVLVKKIGSDTVLVQGKAQIFEANFGWVIEDGHEELQKGFQMTDAGAPAWGSFSFVIRVEKKRANSTLHLILFESSPKDGSRQFELAIPLN
jgi:hypothetical protein